ncbi:MAG TPA: L,D-transpeptidase family protein [Actinomycetes bacterium]|nr:L,D-transpeptidase family protein [Actinomycetes bacterium]
MRTWPRPAGWQRALIAAGLAVVLGGVGAAAVAARAANPAPRILVGVRVAGVDVGGMTSRQATVAVVAATDRWLGRAIMVRAAGRAWRVTPAALGRRAAVDQAVSQAVRGPRLAWWARVWHRLTRRPVRLQVGIAYRGGQPGAAAMVRRIASAIHVAPRDAVIQLAAGRVQRRPARPGRALDLPAAAELLAAAERGGSTAVNLPVRSLPPRVTDARLGTTITIDAGANRLALYDGLRVERSYPVATAMPGFYTPRGTWRVLYKQVDPTWVNPAPHGWGAGEPARIPPGPDDPLGTRALALNAPGILIHGSPASWSIGSYASHGCIRMFIHDAEDLFARVPVGTPVLIYGGGPAPRPTTQAAGA